MAKAVLWLERKLGALILIALRATIRFQVENQEASDHIRCIYALWHRNLLLLTLQRAFTGAGVLVSQSRDGEYIAGPLKDLGYYPIRGSSTRGGARAMVEMVKVIRTMSVAITPDGPKGPQGIIHPGVLQLAFLAKVPIIAVRADAKREWVFNSWDRFRVPQPFTRISVQYSDPIEVHDKADFEDAEQRLRDFLDKR